MPPGQTRGMRAGTAEGRVPARAVAGTPPLSCVPGDSGREPGDRTRTCPSPPATRNSSSGTVSAGQQEIASGLASRGGR
ncbi:hypothetical protein SGRIM128S_02386 [Streptomyces griseomycini]